MSLDIYLNDDAGLELHWQNITHNVSPMWRKAGCRDALYESDGKTAGEILPAIADGLAAMLKDRPGFSALNPENGWGDYEGAMKWLLELATACSEWPDAKVRISA